MHVYIDHLYTSEGRLYISYSTLSHTLKAGAAFPAVPASCRGCCQVSSPSGTRRSLAVCTKVTLH